MHRPSPFALAVLAAASPAIAQPTEDVAVDLLDVELRCQFLGPCFEDQFRDSINDPFPAGPAQFILPATGYSWFITGHLDTTIPLALIVPSGSSLAEFIDIVDSGNSFLTTGYVRYPQASFPDPENTLWSQTFSGAFGNAEFMLDLSLNINLTVTDQGAIVGSITDIDIPTGFLTGTATFTDGFFQASTWVPSPPQQTEWHFDGDFSAAPGSDGAKLDYLDNPAFGPITGDDPGDPGDDIPTGVTQAQSSFMTTTALGIPGPGGEEDTVYCTSPARNLSTNNPDHLRGVGLAFYPATQPVYPGKFFGQWTLIFDLYIPAQSWYEDFPTNTDPREFVLALMQGSDDNTGSADAFFRNTGAGVMTFGTSGDDFNAPIYQPVPIAPDSWFRLALVCDDFSNGAVRVFVDGVFLFETDSSWVYNQVDPTNPQYADAEPIDPADWAAWGQFPSPWALSTGTAPGSLGPTGCNSNMCLFADNRDGASETAYLANMYFIDDMLSDSTIAGLAGPNADGIVLTSAGCNPADLAEPYGALDFSDVLAFLTAFGSAEPLADLAPPTGVFDFSDVIAFLTGFGAGCP